MKLSVCLITFNHERFIAEALQSAVEQQTDFEYEIVVSDDCSTDATRKIITEFQGRYPDKIRLAFPEKNLGVNANLAMTIQACRGQYVALLEGDDYWTSPTKLQEQVSFLDANPACAICFHAVRVFHDDGSTESHISPRFGHKKIFTLEDLLRLGNFIPTCSTVFRNRLFDEFPDWFYELRIADFSLHVFNAQYGKVGYIGKVMGAYRVHSGGTFSLENESRNAQEVIRLYDYLNGHLGPKYDRTIKAIQSYWKAVEYYRNGEFAKAQTCAAMRASAPPFNTQAAMAWLLSHSLPVYRLVKYLGRPHS
ncbi:MAG TPA: glycosyltransferase [Pyrinomonadaceae bacterium]|nr:glycosyltransferase [Pyrinomonadaceae bacterium]